jgi:hypothetical protein
LLLLLFGASGASAQVEESPTKYWVFFTDKGPDGLRKAAAAEQAKAELSERALRRRAKVARGRPLVDETDLPLYPPYIDSLRRMGLEPVVRSRWLNAVSVPLTKARLDSVRALPFVRDVRPVARRYWRPEPSQPLEMPPPPLRKGAEIDYGASFTQNDLINVPEVHRLGITGLGVVVGMLDTGFRYQEHEALQSITVLDEYDFINDDDVTRNEPNDAPGQEDHGTMTLSTIAGFREGMLIGPAFDAAFYLAKTELLPSEIPAEEDYWVAGIEWLERQGVDVVSSSLGYLDWYTYPDMDGDTAVTTKAADLAVAKGVVVVNSAGNEGTSPWRYIIAPADGDSVIAVGAVTSNRQRVAFSSVGPTFDGRIKPDVMAMGAGVTAVWPGTTEKYRTVNGTSFSCPLTAGAVALILSAHPELTPMEVYEALINTADRAAEPDTLYGYGIVNAWDALLYHGPVFSNVPSITLVGTRRLRIAIKAASKNDIPVDGVRLIYHTDQDPSNRTVGLIPSGTANEYVGDVVLATNDTRAFVYFDLTDQAGETARWPFGAPDSTFQITSSGKLINTPGGNVRQAPPTTFALYPNYPNPFNGQTNTIIEFDLPEAARVTLTIYNILGQQVRRLVDAETLFASRYSYLWDARNDRGEKVSGGVYIYVIETEGVREAKQMLYLPQ